MSDKDKKITNTEEDILEEKKNEAEPLNVNNNVENDSEPSKDTNEKDDYDTESSSSDADLDEKTKEEILEDELAQVRDEKLRLLAEMENLRKRSDRDRIDSIRYGSINLARDILSPDDNLTRALEAIPAKEKNSETVKNLIDGLKMVQKEFSTIMEKHGVKKINALNKKFDHNFHQAMMEIESDNVEEGTVVKEVQSGYTMHDRLLRPSMVGVSKKSNNSKKNKEKY